MLEYSCSGIFIRIQSPVSSVCEWWKDTTGGTSRGKNNYWPYFIPKSFTHQQAQQKGLFPLHCYYEMKNRQQMSTVTGHLVYLLVICLLLDRSGHCAVLNGAHPLMISVLQPCAMSYWRMCCTVSAGFNLAACTLSDMERGHTVF